LIEIFEAEGRLDRAVEGLASNDELLRRAQSGQGLTRPELAVLLATAKLWLQDAIEGVDTSGDAILAAGLNAAFPPAMQKNHAQAIATHQLRSQIIATKLANRMVNRMGLIHPLELAEEEGVTLGEVALAFVAAEALHGAPAIWKSIENADVEESARLMLFDQLAIELRVQMADLLRNGWTGMKPSEVVAALAPGMKRVSAEVDALLLGETRRHNEGFAVRLAEAGVPKAIIGAVVGIAKLDGAIGVVTLAKRIKVDELALARAFTLIGAELGLDWAQGAAMQLTPSDPWERLLAAGLARDFQTMRLDFLAKIADKNPEKAVLHWLDIKGPAVTRFRDMTNRAHHAALPSTAMLAQIAGQARQLLA
jgi:glutamate dehydrogenase